MINIDIIVLIRNEMEEIVPVEVLLQYFITNMDVFTSMFVFNNILTLNFKVIHKIYPK